MAQMNIVATGDSILASDHNLIVQTLVGTNGQLLTTTAKGANLASAATLTLGTDGNYFQVTGTTGITAISTAPAGTEVILEFPGAVPLTHNGTSLILIGAVNKTTAAGDVLKFISEGTGNWREDSRGALATAASPGLVPTPPNNTTSFLRGDATFATPPSATSTVAGYVPTPPNNTTTFLRGDATWAAASGGLTKITQIVADGTSGTISFTSIAGTYTSLLLIGQLRSAKAAATTDQMFIRVNNDATANYNHERFSANNAANVTETFGDTSYSGEYVIAASGTANVANLIRVEIPGYAATTFYKNLMVNGSLNYGVAASNFENHLAEVVWKSTAAITQVDFILGTGPFVSGSTITLYGFS